MPEEFADSVGDGGSDALPGAVDVGAASAPAEGGTAPRKRGRPKGSGGGSGGKSAGAGKEKTRHSLDLSSLTGLFVGIHAIAASATGVPEFAIEMSEGDAFMKSAQNVMRHYSVESSQKTIDWLAFGGTCCMIYGTRFGAYMLRKREDAKSQKPGVVAYTAAPASRQAPAPAGQQPAPAPNEAPIAAMEFEFEGDGG